MEKIILMVMLTLALCMLSNVADGKVVAKKTRESLSEVDKKLKLLNKPAVKTIKSEDGDLIDCVDIHKQPAFDHPALKNHKIQMRQSFDLSRDAPSGKHESSRLAAFQTWRKSGTCPEGTVPIRRIRKQELLRANSLDLFGRKNPPVPISGNTTANTTRFVYFNGSKVSVSPPLENRTHGGTKLLRRYPCSPTANCWGDHDISVIIVAEPIFSAAILFTYGFNFIGGSGDINVWNPYVEKPGEFTTSQIWLKGGPGDNFESVESGWAVHPALYGDGRTRLFAYWTTNGYRSAGCFDLTCSGFVQTSQEIALGSAFDQTSSYRYQYFVNISIDSDPESGDWWLKCENISVGYWPKSLFGYLRSSATFVEWGGEVYSSNVRKTPHTRTGMGSGRSAEDLFGWACYINHPHIVDYSKYSKYPKWVYVWTDERTCYSAFNYKQGEKKDVYTDEPVFFFGGPGQSWSCP